MHQKGEPNENSPSKKQQQQNQRKETKNYRLWIETRQIRVREVDARGRSVSASGTIVSRPVRVVKALSRPEQVVSIGQSSFALVDARKLSTMYSFLVSLILMVFCQL